MKASLTIKLSKALAALQSDVHIQLLMKSVKQDAQNETVTFSNGPDIFNSIPPQERQVTRIKIISFLNMVMYATVGFTTWEGTLPWIWFFENHTRLTKLLVVSMVLEGTNLRSFGCIATESDIPQALIHIPMVITFARQNIFPKLREGYVHAIEALTSDSNFGKDYLNLYLK